MNDNSQNEILDDCADVAYEAPCVEEDLSLEVGSLACVKGDNAACQGGPFTS